jgi:hypothetical protein|tara:strand:- start:1176 stop:2459 length:1284 start_codon:yes stop_codon:yes gene_type:complete
MIENNIETYLELLTGLHGGEGNFVIASSDHTILYSISKQVFTGTGLTDRQYDVMKLKLLSYADQFTANNYDVVSAVENTRIPIRQIDRSRWIKIIPKADVDNVLFSSELYGGFFIAVRFTFQKKLISALEKISVNPEYYDKLNKVQYFDYDDKLFYKIMTAFKDSNFEADADVQERYNKLQMINDNKDNFIPGIYGLKLKNLHNKAINYMITDIGDEPNTNNLALYKDRSHLFGITHFDEDELNISVDKLTSLSQRIVKRKHTQILVNSDEHTIDRLAESILELNRYPILVCLNDISDLENLQKLHYSFKNIFNNEDSCVLYRKETTSKQNTEFNQYIKDNNLNNILDINSKIVYTNINKMSKTLLKSKWKPSAVLIMDSVRSPTTTKAYLAELDLVIHYDTDVSPFLKYNGSKYNGVDLTHHIERI